MVANARSALIAAVAAGVLAITMTGCASAPASPPSATTAVHAAAPTEQPLPATRMGCSAETQRNIAKILGLAHPVSPEARWENSTYTCTYRTASGTLVLSVHQSPTDQAARAYFDAEERGASGAAPVRGLANLGLPAYETTDGRVSFVKDAMTLLVDARRVTPPPSGTATRTSVAFEIATAVLACWNG